MYCSCTILCHIFVYFFLVTILEHENALSFHTEPTSTSTTNHLLILTLSDKLISNIGRTQDDSINNITVDLYQYSGTSL